MHRCRPGGSHRAASWHPTIDKNVQRYALERNRAAVDEVGQRPKQENARLERCEREHLSGSTPHPATGNFWSSWQPSSPQSLSCEEASTQTPMPFVVRAQQAKRRQPTLGAKAQPRLEARAATTTCGFGSQPAPRPQECPAHPAPTAAPDPQRAPATPTPPARLSAAPAAPTARPPARR